MLTSKHHTHTEASLFIVSDLGGVLCLFVTFHLATIGGGYAEPISFTAQLAGRTIGNFARCTCMVLGSRVLLCLVHRAQRHVDVQ